VGQQLREFGARNRLAVQEPLGLIATQLPQRVQLVLVLDSFGDHAQSERARKGDHDRHQLLSPGRCHSQHEGSIDLQGIDGQSLEAGERGVSGPEVVNGDSDAGAPQLLQLRDLGCRILGQDPFRDFQIQPAVRRRPSVNALQQASYEVSLAKLLR